MRGGDLLVWNSKVFSKEVTFEQRPKWSRGVNHAEILYQTEGTSTRSWGWSKDIPHPHRTLGRPVYLEIWEERKKDRCQGCLANSWNLMHLDRFVIFFSVFNQFFKATHCTSHNLRLHCHYTVFNTAARTPSFITLHQAKTRQKGVSIRSVMTRWSARWKVNWTPSF